MKRFWKYRDVPHALWEDWKWQLRNRLHNESTPTDFFPNIGEEAQAEFRQYTQLFRLALTPYTLSLVEYTNDLNPVPRDPIWQQFKFHNLDHRDKTTDYDGVNINWELPEELPTHILHHKYSDRAILRVADLCHGYCSYCYLTRRTLDRSVEHKGKEDWQDIWSKSLSYLRRHREVRDVLVSGGDPLLLDNRRIDKILSDLSEISSIVTTRLNTRTLTFNPYRIDGELIEIFKRHHLTVLEVQFVHPREITKEVDRTLDLFDQCNYRPLILWRAPLLRDINDSYEVLEELLTKLYQRRVVPYYLFHCAPYSLGRPIYGTDIRTGIRILLELRRKLPGPAFPRYTLFHPTGKQDIPLELEGTPTFQFATDKVGRPIVTFRNWRGDWVTYPDVP